MHQVNRALAALLDNAEQWGLEDRRLAVGRSLLGAAQLSVIAFSSDRTLFLDVPDSSPVTKCAGVGALALRCLAGTDPDVLTACRFLCIAILLAVAVGFSPRWTCIPHFYVAFSLNTSLTAPDGGENVAQLATMLLIPISLADRRVWQWSRPRAPVTKRARGSSYAAHLVIRLQVAIIYGWAAVSKFGSPGWRHGTAIEAIFNDPSEGLPSALLVALHPLVKSPALMATATWSVIAVELAIAISMFGRRPARTYALGAVIALHLAIMLIMGLFSFGLIMIAMVTIASVDGSIRKGPESSVKPAYQRCEEILSDR